MVRERAGFLTLLRHSRSRRFATEHSYASALNRGRPGDTPSPQSKPVKGFPRKPVPDGVLHDAAPCSLLPCVHVDMEYKAST